MTALLALLFALAATLPTITLRVNTQSGAKNVHLAYTITGPYEGRACVDIDSPEGEHQTVICAEDAVKVTAGETVEVDEDVHGPVGLWVLTPALPDTPDDDDVIYGAPQRITVRETRAASR